MEDNFLGQVLREAPRIGALPALLFVTREGLRGEVVTGGCLDHSDHEVVVFQIVGVWRKKHQENFVPGHGKSRFWAAEEVASMDPWGSAAEGIGVHECWSLFKSRLLRAQEQAFPKEGKSSKQCKGLPWLSRDLLREFRQKERVQTLEAQIGNTGGLERSCLALQGENPCSQSSTRVQADQRCEEQKRLFKIN